MLSFSSLPQESKSNLYKVGGNKHNYKCVCVCVGVGFNYVKGIFNQSVYLFSHSLLNRRLMEFIHGGNGNVDSLFISFALSSVWRRVQTHSDSSSILNNQQVEV